MRRGLWFVAGMGVGVYAVTKARRAAEALSPDGLRDRLAGLSLGAHLLAEDVKAEMAGKETDLRKKLNLEIGNGPDRRNETAHDRQLETGRPLELTREGND
jgi:hypothetical protein